MPLETTITVGDVTYTLADWLAEIENDVPRNVQQEYSWTSMALATTATTTIEWTARRWQHLGFAKAD